MKSNFKKGRRIFSYLGTRPQTPGIYRFQASMMCRRAALPPGHASP
jgi:hypothetical protein